MLVLVGPTGIGKSEVAVSLAERFGCPILNADSRQIYREIPIGTAAPTADQLRRVHHYFVGTHNLDEAFNAGQFERDALEVLSGEEERRKGGEAERVLAILTGGSMMYIDAVCNGLDDMPSVSERIRKEVREGYQTKGLIWLQSEVQRLDPDYWKIVDRSNPQRLMHCVEVSLTLGRPYSTCRTNSTKQRPWRIVKVGLTRPREELYERINQRVEAMVAAGLEQEAQAAMEKYPDLPNGLQTVGYREWTSKQLKVGSSLPQRPAGYSLEEKKNIIEMIKQNTRHYAKRQMTWWNRDKTIHWFEHETTSITVDAIAAYVSEL